LIAQNLRLKYLKLKHGSLFSGIGGFDLAAEMVGFSNCWHCEINPFCQKILKQRFPESMQFEDILNLKYPPPVDIISGGFPCQDISNARTHYAVQTVGLKGSRSGLWFEMLRVIGEVKPRFVVVENVPAINRKGLDVVLQGFSDIGYDAEWATMSAARFGAPHRRNRIWIVAYPVGFGRNEESLVLGKVLGQAVQPSPQWELSRTICRLNGKKALPSNVGIHDGLPRGVDDAERIAALGNAIVPQIAASIFETIKRLFT
jgi:DNA (cytosine-5)-methyltransferase 1